MTDTIAQAEFAQYWDTVVGLLPDAHAVVRVFGLRAYYDLDEWVRHAESEAIDQGANLPGDDNDRCEYRERAVKALYDASIKDTIHDLCDQLLAYGYGDGCLSIIGLRIIVRSAVEDGITDVEDIAEICREAEQDARIEGERQI